MVSGAGFLDASGNKSNPMVPWEVEIDGFPYLGIEEGTEDIQTVQDHAFLGGEGQDQVDGLGVDCRGVGVAD